MDWKAFGRFLVSLFLGFSIGFWVSHNQTHHSGYEHRHHKGPDGKHPPHHARGSEKFLKRFADKLELTEEQRAQIKQIFDSKREQMEQIRKEVQPRFHEIRTTTRNEIRAVLSEQQQKKFDRIHKRMDERRKKRFPGHWGMDEGHRGPPPHRRGRRGAKSDKGWGPPGERMPHAPPN